MRNGHCRSAVSAGEGERRVRSAPYVNEFDRIVAQLTSWLDRDIAYPPMRHRGGSAAAPTDNVSLHHLFPFSGSEFDALVIPLVQTQHLGLILDIGFDAIPSLIADLQLRQP